MYGVRPMDDDEYKDYEQMEIARRERERQRKEKQDYEERQFSSNIYNMIKDRNYSTRNDAC